MAHYTDHHHGGQDANYEFLLMQYAAGALDQAQSMAVTAHLGLSTKGHNMLKRFTSLGGDILENTCKPAEMNKNALEAVLDCLEKPAPQKSQKADIGLPEGHSLTACIQNNIKYTKKSRLKWQTFYPGIQFFDLPLECNKSKAQIIKAKPGKKAPAHEHGGMEITLMLDGAMTEHGQTYEVGDLIVHDADHGAHSPQACPEMGCVCLTVSTEPMRLTGLGRLLNPIIRMSF